MMSLEFEIMPQQVYEKPEVLKSYTTNNSLSLVQTLFDESPPVLGNYKIFFSPKKIHRVG